MFSKIMTRWVAAGAMALAVPAIGLARHASHVTAAPVTPSTLTSTAAPAHRATARAAASTRLFSSHKKASHHRRHSVKHKAHKALTHTKHKHKPTAARAR